MMPFYDAYHIDRVLLFSLDVQIMFQLSAAIVYDVISLSLFLSKYSNEISM